MSVETELTTLLKTLCSRTFPDFAPLGTARPHVSYEAIGGRPLHWLDLTATDKRHTVMQVRVWADTRQAATELMRSIESAMRAATVFTAWPQEEHTSLYDAETSAYGSAQDFEIYSTR